MRRCIPLLIIISAFAYLGCGSGSGIKNATPTDMARRGAGAPGDDDPGPPPSQSRPAAATPAAQATSDANPGAAAASRPARPAASAQNFAGDSDPGPPPGAGGVAGVTKGAGQQPTASAQNFAGDSDPGPPPGAGGVAGVTKGAGQRPTASAQNFASDEDSGPPPGAGVAGGKGAAQRPAAAAQNFASDGDDFDAPNAANQNNATSGAAGGNGVVKSTPANGSAGVGGKGARFAAGAVTTAEAETSEAMSSAAPGSLLDQATKSFDSFEEYDATQRLYAHWLTDDAAMNEYPLQWVAGINEPRILFRWGVGVVYDAPDDYADRPPLIGDSIESTNSAGGRAVQGAKGGARAPQTLTNIVSPYEGVDRSKPFGSLLFYTGDFGERLIKRLDSRRLHKDSYYGKILSVVKFNRDGVEVAGPVVTQRGNAGRLSMATDDDDGGASPVATNRVQNRAVGIAASGSVSNSGTLVPGVIYLGVETDADAEKTLLESGKEAGVDGVLVFYVSVKSKGRSSDPYSVTSLGVHILKTGESQKTATLSSATVAKTREREKDSDNDPVELALDKIFKDYSDEKLRLSAMPEIKPEIAQKRIESLLAENRANPLPVAAEILSYHKGGLLDDAATLAALSKALGSDEVAQKLMSGSQEEKLAAIQKWLPEKAGSPVQGDSDFR